MSDTASAPAKPVPLNPLRREVLGFASVGAAGFATDAGLTVLFVFMGWLTPAVARIPATLIAIAVTFLLNRRWTFRSRDEQRISEFLRYFSVSLAGAAVNYACYGVFLFVCSYTGTINIASSAIVFAAVVAGSAAAAFFNFLGSRYFAFVKRAGAPQMRL